MIMSSSASYIWADRYIRSSDGNARYSCSSVPRAVEQGHGRPQARQFHSGRSLTWSMSCAVVNSVPRFLPDLLCGTQRAWWQCLSSPMFGFRSECSAATSPAMHVVLERVVAHRAVPLPGRQVSGAAHVRLRVPWARLWHRRASDRDRRLPLVNVGLSVVGADLLVGGVHPVVRMALPDLGSDDVGKTRTNGVAVEAGAATSGAFGQVMAAGAACQVVRAGTVGQVMSAGAVCRMVPAGAAGCGGSSRVVGTAGDGWAAPACVAVRGSGMAGQRAAPARVIICRSRVVGHRAAKLVAGPTLPGRRRKVGLLSVGWDIVEFCRLGAARGGGP